MNNITALTAFKEWAFVGYQNGMIFNAYDEDIVIPKFTSKAITYLKLVKDNILLAASNEDEITLVKNLNTNIYRKYQINTRHCYPLFDNYLILINNYGAVVVGFYHIITFDYIFIFYIFMSLIYRY